MSTRGSAEAGEAARVSGSSTAVRRAAEDGAQSTTALSRGATSTTARVRAAARPLAAGASARATTSGSPEAAIDPAGTALENPASAVSSVAEHTGSPVHMQDMIDSIGARIQVAARQGVTQARIALHPQELGEVRVHLTQSSAGLIARVTADTPAAARALSEGHSELAHTLSSLGVSLLRLDIGSPGQQQAGGGEARNSGEPQRAQRSESTPDEHEDAVAQPDQPAVPAGSAIGELVDVLA